MPLIQNTIVGFLAWWIRGLVAPFENLLPKASPIVLKRVGIDLVDQQGRPFTREDKQGIKRDIYLLAPLDKTMSKRIKESQRGLPLYTVAEEILPFSVGELMFASDLKEVNIHAVLRSDLSIEAALAQEQGLRIVGVAFDDGVELMFANHNVGDERSISNVIEEPATTRSDFKLWFGLTLLLLFSLVLWASLAFDSRLQSQERLGRELVQLQTQLNEVQSKSEASIATRIKTRGAAEVSSVLNFLATSMTDSTSLSQLILSDNELIIDASAGSATQVQANLDDSGAFASIEFVSSISRNADDGAERFRLKASVKDETLK